MNQNSNLVSTPIVDKNGKLTTVHKKSQRASNAAPPNPSLMTKPEPATPEINYFTDLLCYSAHIEADSYTINQTNPSVIPHINELLSTDNEETLRAVTNALNSELASLRPYIVSLGDADVMYREPGYPKLCSLKATATAAYEISTLSQELKTSSYYIAIHIDRAVTLHEQYHPRATLHSSLKDQSYWRGLSLFTIITDEISTRDDPTNFINWAMANSDKTADIYRIAKLHKTLNLNHLSALLSQDTSTSPSLTDGLL